MLTSMKLTIVFVICLYCSLTFCYTTKNIETLETLYMSESVFINSVTTININSKHLVL